MTQLPRRRGSTLSLLPVALGQDAATREALERARGGRPDLRASRAACLLLLGLALLASALWALR